MTEDKNERAVEVPTRRKFLQNVGVGVPFLTKLSQGRFAKAKSTGLSNPQMRPTEGNSQSHELLTFDRVQETRSEVGYEEVASLYGGPISKHAVISVKAHPEVIWVRPDMGIGMVANPFAFGVGAYPLQVRWREVRRWLQDGHLPIVISRWQDGSLVYEQVAFATLLGSREVRTGHEKQVAMVQMSVVNMDPSEGQHAALWSFVPGSVAAKAVPPPPYNTYDLFDVVGSLPPVPEEPLTSADNSLRKGSLLLGIYSTDPDIRTTVFEKVLKFEMGLRPGERRSVRLAVSSNSKGFSAREIESLRDIDFLSVRDRRATDLRSILAQGSQICVPEQVVNNIWKAQILYNQPQMVQAADRDYYMPVQGYLGVWPWEAMKMLVPLDAMGYHDDVRKSLEYFLKMQDKYPPFGQVKDYSGYFSGTGAFEESGWEKDPESTIYGVFAEMNKGNQRGFPGWMNWTGSVLYTFAEHYFYTNDRTWLQSVAAPLLKACNWIVKERQQTKQMNSEGQKVLQYGLMPAGEPYDNSFTEEMEHSLAYFFCFTDGYTCQGLNRIAQAFAEIGHPEGQRLLEEAKEYHHDVLEVMRRVRQTDPNLPPYPDHLNGPSTPGWADFACGALALVDTRFIDPNDPALLQLENYMKKHYNRNAVGLTGGLRKDGDLRFPNAYYVDFSEDIWQRVWMLRGETEKALLAFYSTLAFGVDKETLGSVERFDLYDQRYSPFFMDASGSSRIVGMVRQTLLMEEGAVLHLLKGVPRRWLEDGKSIEVKDGRTYFGRIDLREESRADQGKILVNLSLQILHLERLREIQLRIPHPSKREIKQVLVNGKAWQQLDRAREVITITPVENQYAVEIQY